MNIKTNTLILLAFIAVMLHSCMTSEYPGMTYSPGNDKENQETIGTLSITPTLNYNTLFFNSASRGAGAFDHEHYIEDFTQHFLNSEFFILSYRRSALPGSQNAPTDFTQLMHSNTNPDRRDCLLSTEKMMLQEKDNRGKTLKPVDLTGALAFIDDVTKKDAPQYWNSTYTTTGYDFFGYYLDDAKIEKANAFNDRTSYDITIDGTQDLMVGAAPEVTTTMLKEHYPGITNDETREKIAQTGNGAYSTFGASHGVQPKIDLRHCLSRIMLQCTSKQANTTIVLKEVAIKAKNHGTMTVASRNKGEIGFQSTGEYEWMLFPDALKSLQYNKAVLLGPGIMIPEEDEYELRLVFDETVFIDEQCTKTETKTVVTGADGNKLIVKMNDDTFRAGMAYYINIIMYGSTNIDIEVSLTDTWKDGGAGDITMQD